ARRAGRRALRAEQGEACRRVPGAGRRDVRFRDRWAFVRALPGSTRRAGLGALGPDADEGGETARARDLGAAQPLKRSAIASTTRAMPKMSRGVGDCAKRRREIMPATKSSTRPSVRTRAGFSIAKARNHISEAKAPMKPAGNDGRQATRTS